MVLLGNSTNHLRNSTNVMQTLPENRGVGNNSQLILWGQQYPDIVRKILQNSFMIINIHVLANQTQQYIKENT